MYKCTACHVANQRGCCDIINKIIYERQEAEERFTVRLSALVIAPELLEKNNACSAIYTEYLTFLQKLAECNLSRGHCGGSGKMQAQ